MVKEKAKVSRYNYIYLIALFFLYGTMDFTSLSWFDWTLIVVSSIWLVVFIVNIYVTIQVNKMRKA